MTARCRTEIYFVPPKNCNVRLQLGNRHVKLHLKSKCTIWLSRSIG